MRFDIPWSGEMNRLQNEMEQLFGSRRPKARAYPPINLWEDEDHLYIEAEIPGIDLDDLELYVNDEQQLTLQGQRKRPQEEHVTRHRSERAFGRFSRVIPLPANIDADSTSADYKSGVLTIRLAKKEEAKPRRIKISAE